MRQSRNGRQLLAALVALLGCAALLTGVPSRASAAALSGAAWTASSTVTSASTVSYTFTLVPRTGSTLSKVTMAVGTAVGGAPAVGAVTPSAIAGGSVSMSGGTLTYAFTPVSVAAGLVLSIQFAGLKNPATAGSLTATVTTYNGTSAVDTGTASFAFTSTTLSGVSWTTTSTATLAADVSYTYKFSPSLLNGLFGSMSVTISVPPGTSGMPTLDSASTTGLTGVSLSGNTLTVTGTIATVLGSFTVAVDGLTNTYTAGSYVPELVTYNGGGTVLDSGVAAAVSFPGSLAVGAPASLTWSGTLNGQNQMLADTNAADQLLTVNDQTGSQAGWHVTVSVTNFVTSGGSTLPSSGVLGVSGGAMGSTWTSAAPTAACSGSAACTVPDDSAVTYPVVITSAASSPAAATIYDAKAGTGIGLVSLGGSTAASPLGWWVSVPGYAPSGTFSSTVTVSIISGP